MKDVRKQEQKQRGEEIFVILCLLWSCSIYAKPERSHRCKELPSTLSFYSMLVGIAEQSQLPSIKKENLKREDSGGKKINRIFVE